jgi:hypothetical protein
MSQALLFGDNTNSLVDQISSGQAHGTVPSVSPWPIGITESATSSSDAEPSIDMDLFSDPIDPLGAMIEIPHYFDWVSYILLSLQLQRDLSLYTEYTLFQKKMLRISRKLLIARLGFNKPLRKPGQTSCKTSRLKMMVIIYNLLEETNTTTFFKRPRRFTTSQEIFDLPITVFEELLRSTSSAFSLTLHTFDDIVRQICSPSPSHEMSSILFNLDCWREACI